MFLVFFFIDLCDICSWEGRELLIYLLFVFIFIGKGLFVSLFL